MRSAETLIVGAGISGISCARALHAANRDFRVLSKDIGGRILRARDGSMNMGAYYVMRDYHHVRKWVRVGRNLDRAKGRLHRGDRTYSPWGMRLFAHLPSFFRLRQILREFRDHYEEFKRSSETTSQARAIRNDPYLWKMYHGRALDLIREHRIEEIARHLAAPALHGSTFMPLERLSAFNFLQFSLPLIVGIDEFELRVDDVIEEFRDAFQITSVVGVTREGSGYRIETQSGESLTAKHVVIATPIQIAQRLLHLPEIKEPVRAHSFAISGRLRGAWTKGDIHLFSDSDSTLAISRQTESRVLFCSRQEKPDFGRFFSDYEILDHVYWNPAFHLDGEALLECEQGENLYMIGDYNVCGLEDSYITGLYAANRILGAAD